MSDPSRHQPRERESSQGDGAGSTVPNATQPQSSPLSQHHQHSSIPLPTALSNAQDLRPGAWPEGHPMSRPKSDGDLREITWLTAKVREVVSLFLFCFSIDDRSESD